MAITDDIKQHITDLKKHYDTNLNNKFVKNINLKLDIALDIRHKMNFILENKTFYFDTKGSIDDIYSSIKAITIFIKEIRIKVLPNIYNYTGNSFFTSGESKNPNDKVLYQMAVKNYPMNLKLLANQTLQLLNLVIEFDKTNFSKDPVYKKFGKIEELSNYLKEIANESTDHTKE